MKKLLIVFLSVILVIMMASAAMAAPIVTFSGNTRFWFVSYDNGAGKTLSSFQFDRFDLNTKVKLSDASGITSTTSVRSIKGTADIREEAFFWAQGVFSKTDELDIGAIGVNTYLPFRNNGATNANVSVGVGNAMKIGQTVGLIYTFNQPSWNIGIGIANARKDAFTGQSGDTLNQSLRFNYLPYKGWKVGFGYEIVANDTDYNYNNGHDDRWVVDAAYKGDPFMLEIEYGGMARNATNTTTNYSAASVELGYKVSPVVTAWVGRVFDGKDGSVGKMYNGGLTGSSCDAKANNDFSVIGLSYALPIGADILMEYVKVDNFGNVSGENAFGIRLKASF